MGGCAGSTLFLLHYDVRRVVVTPHFSARRLQRRGRRSYWALAHVECHYACRPPPLLFWTTGFLAVFDL